jgi:hypothetical protein
MPQTKTCPLCFWPMKRKGGSLRQGFHTYKCVNCLNVKRIDYVKPTKKGK